jgi:threonine dehydrogenase-like Zn-dependent dehydrogenase
MRALVYDGSPRLVHDRPDPTAAAGEVLIRVRLAGVCSTDLEICRGYMGFTGVMGHEFVGEVLRGPDPWPGKRVVGEINCPCGRCPRCRANLGNHCPHRSVLGIAGRDGVLAELTCLPADNLHEVPDNVPDDAAVYVEPLAAGFQVARQVDLGPATRVVVLGDGRLAQLTARALRLSAPDLLLVSKHPAKRQRADDAGIATVNLPDYRPDRSADVVVEATGSPAGLALAMRAVRPRGVIVLKSTTAAGAELNLAPLVVDEITVVGSRCGPFDRALHALAGGEVRVADLTSETFPLSRAEEALGAARRPDTLKVLVDPRG